MRLFCKQLTLYKIFIIISFYIMGSAFGVINTFLFLWLLELGGTTTLMGFTLIVTVSSEIPSFYFADKVLSNPKIGELGVIGIGLFAYMLRLSYYACLGYNFLSNPWYVLFSEVLHGLTFAWIWSSLAIFAYRLVHDENENQNENEETMNKKQQRGNITAKNASNTNARDNNNGENENKFELKQLASFSQGFLSSVFNGLGQATGTLVGGFVYDRFGGHVLFFGFACVLLPFFIVFSIRFLCCNTSTKLAKFTRNMLDD